LCATVIFYPAILSAASFPLFAVFRYAYRVLQ
jgi:hypothetical protein